MKNDVVSPWKVTPRQAKCMDAWITHGVQRVAAPAVGISRSNFKREVAFVRIAMGDPANDKMFAMWQQWSPARPLPEAIAAAEAARIKTLNAMLVAYRKKQREQSLRILHDDGMPRRKIVAARDVKMDGIVQRALKSRKPLESAWCGGQA
ncbi:MAG: hypothetical protein ACRC1H_19275 [Caldilineaceae bacterium]